MPSVTLVRGPGPALAAHPAFFQPGVIHLGVGDFPRPWALARALLSALANLRGLAALERAVSPHRGPLSLVLGGLQHLLGPRERVERENAAAASLGFLSHNWAIVQVLSDAWLGVFRELLEGDPIAIAVIRTLEFDPPSIALLRRIAHELPDRAPRLILGEATDLPALPPLWQRSRLLVQTHLALWEAHPTTRVIEVDGRRISDQVPPSWPIPPALWDDEEDLRAAALLRAGPIDRDASLRVLEAMRACFRCVGFDATLRLGVDLLAKGPVLEPGELAEAHTLVALSAYNRQVQTEGDQSLADFLNEHFREALRLETDTLRRAHLLYRLAINEGRRKGQLAQALELADKSVAAPAGAAPGARAMAAFVEAWARNGRAYVLARMRRLEEAIRDCEHALALAQGVAGAPGVPVREAAFTPIVLADNLAELCMRAGDSKAARRWQDTLASLEAAFFGRTRLAFFRLVTLRRHAGDLAGAQRSAEAGLAAAQAEADVLSEDGYAAMLGELLYRRGDASGAARCFKDALLVRRRLASPEDIRATEVAAALSCLRAGGLAEADEHLSRAEAATDEQQLALLAQLAAYRGLTAAHAGDGAEADAHTNRAVELAVASGERDTLLRVARLAGESCRNLGRLEDAAQAFAQALELAGADEDGGAPDPPPEDLLPVHIGLVRLTGDPAHLEAAFALLPQALHDPEAWWALPDLLELRTAMRGQWPDELADGLEAAQRAACQRIDMPQPP